MIVFVEQPFLDRPDEFYPNIYGIEFDMDIFYDNLDTPEDVFLINW